MQNLIEFPLAFLAGLLSFLSPCVLPLLPSYVAILTGNSQNNVDKRILGRSIAFTLGFSIVFVIFGIVFSQASMILGSGTQIWSIIAGIIIIFLGINIIFDIFSFLNIEKRFHLKQKPAGFISCLLFGAAFGAGWSPCVGPLLASILLMAGNGSWGRAAFLLILYSFGFALPFIFASFFLGRLEHVLLSIKKYFKMIKIVSGSVLIIMGVYMMAGKIRTISGSFVVLASKLERFSWENPFLSDAIFSFFYAAIFLVLVLLRISKRKKLRTEEKITKTSGLFLLIFGFFFGILAILEAANIISTPEFIASWLRFQGI